MWYKDGLYFNCTQCGKCCTGFEGIVLVSNLEIGAMSAFLNLSQDVFKKRYLRLVNQKWALLETHENFDCIFYKNKKCTIYPVRPKQCKTYPFWPSILKSKKTWQKEKHYCEGIEHKSSKLISLESIKKKD
ncbi:MAG: hypothetical protein K940chlam8_00608 [Chlamydiae bacterium]|nr:hypothetical protein [Chlamydiota bacterium]